MRSSGTSLRRTSWCCPLLVVILTAAPGVDAALARSARSASSDASRVAEAKKLFDRAEVQYRLGNFEAALALYKAALERARRPSLVFNIAQCHRFLEQPKRALFFYELYLAEWKRAHPDTPPPNEAEVLGHIAALRRQAASSNKAQLVLEGVPPGATVLVDGMFVAKGPIRAALQVEPGTREVRVEARGYRPAVYAVTVRAGQTARQKVSLARQRGRSSAWLVTGIVSGALAVGAEVTALVMTRKANQEVTGTAGFERYRNAAIAGHVAAGALAVGAGLSFWRYVRSGDRGEASAQTLDHYSRQSLRPAKVSEFGCGLPAALEAGAGLGLAPLPGGGLVTAVGRF